jgi:hypothetical protein
MKRVILTLTVALLALFALAGCTQLAETAQKVSDDLGDKALQAHAFVDIWKVETSDSTANGSPTGKKITIIGDVKSIPMTSKDGATVKDYAEYRKTKTPAWYNSDNVTEEETFIGTGDNAKEVAAFFKAKREKAEAEAKAAEADKTAASTAGTLTSTAAQ